MAEKEAALLFLFITSIAFAYSCELSTDFPLLAPGFSTTIYIDYSNFSEMQPIVLSCKPGDLKFCEAVGTGRCEVNCSYFYQGLYTISAASPQAECHPTVVSVSPSSKPVCIVSASPPNGKVAFSSRISAKFANLVPNSGIVKMSCGRNAPTLDVPLVNNGASIECIFASTDSKVAYRPNATIGGALCNTTVYAYPAYDRIQPQVSLLNMSYREAVNKTKVIRANATDNVDVAYVDFYVDGEAVANATREPYAFLWNASNLTEGSVHSIYARAYDTSSNAGNSQVHYIYVAHTTQPSCNLTTEMPYGVAPVPINFTITFFNLSSNVFTASVVRYRSDTMNYTIDIDERGIARTTVIYSNIGAFTAVAYGGNTSCERKVYIVASEDRTAPSVSISKPTSEVFSLGGQFQIDTDVSDNVAVRNVEFYMDNRFVGNDTEPDDFNISYDASRDSIGEHEIRVVASDWAGNTAEAEKKISFIYNASCLIAPRRANLLGASANEFSVSCKNWSYVMINATIAILNITEDDRKISEYRYNYTAVEYRDMPCPDMVWYTTVGTVEPDPSRPGYALLSLPQVDKNLRGTVIVRDPVTGLSCTSDLFVSSSEPKCRVNVSSPSVVGADVEVDISYDLSEAQTITVTCRPDVRAMCEAASGSGTCRVLCPFPSAGQFTIYASSEFASCSPANLTVEQKVDVTPPAVSITNPMTGSRISGEVRISAVATDFSGILRVDFYVGSEELCRAWIAPYTCLWNVTGQPGTTHILRARAYDRYANYRDVLSYVQVS